MPCPAATPSWPGLRPLPSPLCGACVCLFVALWSCVWLWVGWVSLNGKKKEAAMHDQIMQRLIINERRHPHQPRDPFPPPCWQGLSREKVVDVWVGGWPGSVHCAMNSSSG